MKCLNRNKSQFYFSNYRGKKMIEDENGRKTGEYTLIYSEFQPALGNISAAKGKNELEQFGSNLNYDKVIVTETDYGIKENAILWVDLSPYIEDYDYVVKRVAKSLNSVSIAISKVDVSNE